MDKRTILFIISLTLTLFFVRLGFDYMNKDEKAAWALAQAQKQSSAPKAEEATEAPFVASTVSEKPATQEYYILENDYLQLVFSNIGGSLVEINLPFKTAKNTLSAVLPIEIDREMLEKSPHNAIFPLRPAKDSQGKMHAPVLGGYYPLIRRDIIGQDAGPSFLVPTKLHSLNVVSEYPEVASLNYEVKSFTANSIVLEASQPHRRITKTFSFPKENVPYSFNVTIKVEGDQRGLWLTSGVPEVEWQSGASGSVIKYRITKGKGNDVLKVDLPSSVYTNTTTAPDWISNGNGFFGIILDPTKGRETGFKVDKVTGKEDPSRIALIDPEYARYSQDDMAGYNVLTPLKAQSGVTELCVFAGPFGEKVLTAVDEYNTKVTGTSTDFIACQTYFGWFSFISEPFAKMLFFLMKMCHAVTGSWALSIVFVTIVLRLLLYPLNTWSIKSMKGMQEVGPQIKQIQEKYKKDPQKAQMEILAIYRAKGVNPISGCLPLILQLPFLIGMFDLLKTTFELRGVPFIPGWIDNLTSPDVLFTWGYHLPIIGNEFHLLPIILGGIMYFQQNVMSSLPKDVNTWTDQQRQQRMMGNIMTVVMTVMFYNFPSGLNIYWISSMLLGILQQWWTTKKMQSATNNGDVVIEVKPTSKKLPKKG
ncbi:MAG: membrane protein insertase YidC [Chlamydiales bacterium]|nr:membrane protein insertase YidC [Chlamydiales bacterium]